jgi:hypothetical protein
MKWAVIVVRSLVGLGFTFSGLTWFLPIMELPPPPEGAAGTFGKLLMDTGYMNAVKTLELVGGLMLLSGRLAPLGITLLMPVAVNILLFELFLLKQPGPGVVLVPLLAFLVWGYRRYFAPVFTTRAEVTG